MTVYFIAAYDPLNRPHAGQLEAGRGAAAPPASAATVGFGYDATNRRITETASDKSWLSYPTAASSTAYTANNLNQYSTARSRVTVTGRVLRRVTVTVHVIDFGCYSDSARYRLRVLR